MKKSITQTLLMWTRYAFSGLIMICLLNSSLLADKVAAQSVDQVRISLKLTNATLGQTFLQIEKLTEFTFAFNQDQFSSYNKVNLRVENETLRNVLLEISRQSNLAFRQVNQRILVKVLAKPKNTTIEERMTVEPASLVTGKVTEAETGEPLPGVNILVKNTALGTVSDIDGFFRIEVPEENNTLIFSFIGYAQQEININDRSTIDVVMQPSGKELDEVVVIGYGEQERRDLTGSVASIKREEITQVTTPSLDNAIQGQIPGVQVFAASGAPGGSMQVLIRGASSVTGNNIPLYVIDGIPLFGDDNLLSKNISDGAGPNPEAPAVSILSSINPDDIESIDVLKDASATAIYGARAANGVVIITTKRGKAGNPTANIKINSGVSQLGNTIPVINGLQYAQLNQEARFSWGNPYPFSLVDIDSIRNATGTEYGTDWQKEVFRIAPLTEINASLSGGSEAARYNVSGGLFDQQGIVINTYFRRYSLRANVDLDPTDKFKIGISTSTAIQEGNMAQDSHFGERSTIFQAVASNPLMPIFHPEFNSYASGPLGIPGFPSSNNGNVVRILNTDLYSNNILRFTGNIFGEYKIVPGLKAKLTLGTDLIRNHQQHTRDAMDVRRFLTNEIQQLFGITRLKETYSNIRNIVHEGTLTYAKAYDNGHNLTVLAGYSLQELFNNFTSADARGGTNNALHTFEYNQQRRRLTGDEKTSRINSIFARLMYDYQGKYYFTGTIRRDGSSKFGPDRRFGYFPSFALAWRISNESFFNVPVVDDLKIRGSWGLTGNQNIGDFRFLGLASSSAYAWGNSLTGAVAPASLGVSDLGWESSNQIDIGIDLSLFNGILNINADWFSRTSNDLLLNIPLPGTTGTTITPTVNLGSVRNSGLEFLVKGNFQRNDFGWYPSFNISTINNIVLDLGRNPAGGRNEFEGLNTNTGGTTRGAINIAKEGESIGSFYGYVFDGIFQTKEEAANHPAPAWLSDDPNLQLVAGDVKYRDRNRDGVIDENDREILGSPVPDFFGGFQNEFTYRNWRLSVFTNFQVGHELYNFLRQQMDGNGGSSDRYGGTSQYYYNNYWRPDRTEGTEPRAGNVTRYHNSQPVSSRWVEDASYLRIRNVSLTYSLPNSLISRWKLNQANITANVTNPFTFTSYSGFDPETSGRGVSPLNAGVDMGTYPIARIYSLALNLSF